LGDVNFQKEQGIIIKRIPLTEIHCAVRDKDFILEDEDIVVGSNAMPTKDWHKGTVLSWITQFLYGMGAGFFVSAYLFDKHNIAYTDFYEFLAVGNIKANAPVVKDIITKLIKGADGILSGKPRSTVVHEFGNVYRDYEEASFFSVGHDKDIFYAEFLEVTKEFLSSRGQKFDEDEIKEIFEYQKARTPSYKPLPKTKIHFEYNSPEYFERYFDKKIPIIKSPQVLVIENVKDYNGNKEEFARDMIRRRRNNAVLYNAKLVNDVVD